MDNGRQVALVRRISRVAVAVVCPAADDREQLQATVWGEKARAIVAATVVQTQNEAVCEVRELAIKSWIPAKIHRLQSCREAIFRLPVHRLVRSIKLSKFALAIEGAQQ